jgi:hypothetical protein
VEVHRAEHLQATVPTPEARPQGPSLTPDDLIDFHFELAGDDWFARLVAPAE